MSQAWAELDRELDRWCEGDRVATLWWRDDDAVAATAALETLLSVAGPAWPALAVIPAALEASLAERLAGAPRVAVLQHGYAHVNHAGPGEKKIELGGTRPPGRLLRDLERGRERLRARFGARALPVLVPPWNRIDDAVRRGAAGKGFRAVSAMGARARHGSPPGPPSVNCHVDLIDWRGTRGCREEAALLTDLVEHLRGRRAGRVVDEPTGLLTHHLVHDAACWRFVERLLERTVAHPGARWADPGWMAAP